MPQLFTTPPVPTTAVPTASPGSSGIPVIGWITGPTDTVIDEMAAPLWAREIFWLVVSSFLIYATVRLLMRRVLPWLGPRLAEPVAFVVALPGLVLLFSDFVLCRLLAKTSRTVPSMVYSVGDNVQHLTAAAQKTVRAAMYKLYALRRTPGWVCLIMLLAVIGEWNSTTCTNTGPGCVSPISDWQQTFSQWAHPSSASPPP